MTIECSRRVLKFTLFLSAFFIYQSSQAELGLGLNVGATYKNSYQYTPTGSSQTTEYKRSFGFPAFGISTLSGSSTFQMRSYLEYSTYKTKFTGSWNNTGYVYESSNNILSWMTFATFKGGKLYGGPGGGVGYEKTTLTTGYAFVGVNLGYQINNMLALDLRLFTPIDSTSTWKNIWGVAGLNFLIASGKN